MGGVRLARGTLTRALFSLASIPVTELRGVGAKKEESLEILGIKSVLDLLTYYPRRYIDRTREGTIAAAVPGEEVLLLGSVSSIKTRRLRSGKIMIDAVFSDGSGRLTLVFFNQSWRERQLRQGGELAIFGKIDLYKGKLQMTNPIVDIIGDRVNRIVPIYPLSEKAALTTYEIARLVEEALSRAGELTDPVPLETIRVRHLLGRTDAFRQIHAPKTLKDSYLARERLAFDELLRLQLVLVARKHQFAASVEGIPHDTSPYNRAGGALVKSFLGSLPFPLTSAQSSAILEISGDMSKGHPMHRLLQGDVGSGKTLVALVAMLFAVQGGHQGALLAPTEVLAEQHWLSLSTYLTDMAVKEASEYSLFAGAQRNLRVELITGNLPVAARRMIQRDLAAGSIDIVVGTHALLSEGVEFNSLGLAVVDEQHRFGVEQRSLLRERARGSGGRDPDVLVMTATPIPRTAAMTVYGDLDVSILDELPPGRTPIKTVWAREDSEVDAAFEHLRKEIDDGRQAYVVCPLVEESEKLAARSAISEFQRLAEEALAGLSLGLMHGQMKGPEKEAVMAQFRSGAIDVLVATTVIEVGVDVPNATVMVIEDADRFGIAQLHQLRGRVGRGASKSYCYLLSNSDSTVATERLEALVASTDGFALAEKDLQLRGEGTILGARQRGRNDLKLASIARDLPLIKAARTEAERILQLDPRLESNVALRLELETSIEEEEAEFLFRS